MAGPPDVGGEATLGWIWSKGSKAWEGVPGLRGHGRGGRDNAGQQGGHGDCDGDGDGTSRVSNGEADG